MKSILLPTVLVSIVFVVLISLGFWQLDRAKQKEHILSEISLQQNIPPVLVTHSSDLEHKEHRTIILKGQYLDKHILYDNQTLNGVYGYYLISPFILKDSHQVVLVNRGFKQWEAQRTLPHIATTDVEHITARVSTIKSRPTLSSVEHTKITPNFPLIMQSLDTRELSEVLQVDIPNILLLLQSDEKDGYIREHRVYHGISIDKHKGYAFQWFMMAAVLLIISLRLLIRRRR